MLFINMKFFRVLLIISLSIFAIVAVADDDVLLEEEVDSVSGASKEYNENKLLKNWDFRVGIFSFVMPRHDGSKSMRVFAVPLLSAKYRGFLTFRYTGISALAPVPYTNYKLFAGITFNYDYIGIGVNNFDEKEYGITITPTVMLSLSQYFVMRTNFIKTVGGSDSLGIELRFQSMFNITDKLSIAPEVFTVYGDKRWMDLYFSVDESESVQHNLPVFDAQPNITRVGAGAMLMYKFSPSWMANVILSSEFLLNDAALSPTTDMNFVPRFIFMFTYNF